MNPALGKDDPVCGCCGDYLDRYDCESCDGTGETEPGELHEQDPLWYAAADTAPCHACAGRGGGWECWRCNEREP